MNLLLRRDFFAAVPGLCALLGRRVEPDPFRDPVWVARWKQAPRRPIWESSLPTEQHLLTAITRAEPLRIRYHGGGTPGAARLISPSLLFESEGYSGRYLAAHCHLRQAPRTFCVELLEIA